METKNEAEIMNSFSEEAQLAIQKAKYADFEPDGFISFPEIPELKGVVLVKIDSKAYEEMKADPRVKFIKISELFCLASM